MRPGVLPAVLFHPLQRDRDDGHDAGAIPGHTLPPQGGRLVHPQAGQGGGGGHVSRHLPHQCPAFVHQENDLERRPRGQYARILLYVLFFLLFVVVVVVVVLFSVSFCFFFFSYFFPSFLSCLVNQYSAQVNSRGYDLGINHRRNALDLQDIKTGTFVFVWLVRCYGFSKKKKKKKN